MLGDLFLPGESVAGHFEIGGHKGGEAGLGAATDPGGAFVADFPAHAGGSAGEGGDGGRVVMRLHLAKDVQLASGLLVAERAVRLVDLPPFGGKALEHAGVVRVGDEHAVGIEGMGIADHFEEAEFALLAVHDPVGIENLVAAVLRVDL